MYVNILTCTFDQSIHTYMHAHTYTTYVHAYTFLTKMDMRCAYGAVNAAHVQATAIPHICATSMLHVYTTCAACTHACYRYAAQVFLACMHITTVLHICHLHTCKLLVFLIYAAFIHACYYIQHTCSIHAAYIQHTCCTYKASFSCVLHTQKLKCATCMPHTSA